MQHSESAVVSDEQRLDDENVVATTPPPQSELDRLLLALTADEKLPNGTISDAGLQHMIAQNRSHALPTWTLYPWNCARCADNCGSAAGVRRHFRNEHSLLRVQYACRDCPKALVKYRSFIDHVRQRHEPLLRLCCDICSAWFWDVERLREHRAGHPRQPLSPPTVLQQSEDDADAVGNVEELTLRLDDEQSVDGCVMEYVDDVNECDMCWKPFGTPATLMAHRRKAHGLGLRHQIGVDGGSEPRFSCDLCCKT